MVTTQGNDTRVTLSVERERLQEVAARIIPKRGRRSALKKLLVTTGDLFDSVAIVVGSHRDVTTVHDLKTGLERVDLEGDVIPTVQGKTARTCPNTRWSKASTGPVRCPGILRKAVRTV